MQDVLVEALDRVAKCLGQLDRLSKHFAGRRLGATKR
jgi:hypothetical protein